MNATIFANSVLNNFQKIVQSKSGQVGEIKLFQSLIESLKLSSSLNHAHVEEYHGNKRQVSFNGSVVTSRPNARCELSDIFLVSFNSKYIRLTFLQAKYDKNINPKNLLSGSMKCDPEQWDLLANQKHILNGWNGFNPPKDLLSGAYSSSIGSFGVFYKSGNSYDMLFSVADSLNLNQTTYLSKSGSFKSKNTHCCTRKVVGPVKIEHTLNCCNLICFSLNISLGLVGSPLLFGGKMFSPSTAIWLLGVLKDHVRLNPDQRHELANNLIDILKKYGVEDSQKSSNILMPMMIIKTNEEIEERLDNHRLVHF